MSLEKVIEEKIQEAMANGEFDNLRGHGKPLDLSAYFSTPEEVRIAYAMLKSNEFVPREVELMREVDDLRSRLRAAVDDAEKTQIRKRLHDRQLALDITLEQGRRRRK
jgi:hypothetical protein